ncbi:MAG TPA: tetratricopeptide repeat protein [Gemmatimonadales bacterium]|jgi:Tfp pilus assembly protein PilF|nr:tetratricopeptide repeat protein [Gemmatimonadales bacterium]
MNRAVCVVPVVGIALAAVLHAQSLKVAVPLPELQARAAKDSLDPAAHYNLAVGYMGKKKFPEAEQSLQAALAIDPRFAEAQLALAVARERNEGYWNQLKGDSARRAAARETRLLYQRAFLIDPFVDVQLMALLFHVPSGWSSYLDAIKALVEGRYPEAYRGLGKQIDDRPKGEPRDSAGTGLLWLHALAAVQVREYASAEEDIQALIRLTSQLAQKDSVETEPLDVNEYRYMLAALKQRSGAYAEAVGLYQEVLEADMSNYMAHVQLARIHEEAKDWPAAVAERRRAVEVQPEDASLLTDLGVTLGRSGDFAAAVEVLRQASAANPRDVRPLFWLGVAEMQLNNREAARDAFTRFMAVAPSRQEAQVNIAKQRLAALQ